MILTVALPSYLIVNNVVYLVIADKSYPRKLAFSYLDELSKEFELSYGAKVENVRKPYAFVGFGAFRAILSFAFHTDAFVALGRYIYGQNC